MAIGGNIRVTLTLDDAGFTVKTQQASKGVASLNTEIKSFSSGLTKAEGEVKVLGDRVNVVAKEFTALSGYAQTASKSLNALAASGGMLDRTTAGLVTSFTGLQNMVTQLATKMGLVTEGMQGASTAGNALSRTNRDLTNSSKATADGLTRQERAARNLGAATEQTAAIQRLSALQSKDLASQQLAAELTKNTAMVASKKEALASMIRAEQQYNRQLEAAKAQAMATSMKITSGRNERGQFVKPTSEYMQALTRQLQLEQAHVAALQKSVDLIGQETAKMQGVITTTNQRNEALQRGLALRERDIANVNRYQNALREGNQTILNGERARRAEIAQQNSALRDQMGMVKSLGQMWGAMKIYQGEKASVASAAEYQLNQIKAQAMGLNPQQQKDFTAATWRDSKNTPGMSVLDAQRAREAAMGGLAIKDQATIDQTLPGAMTAAKNIQFMQGDSSKENFGDLVRNLYGFIEMRQQQYQPDAANKSFDLITQIESATGGKIDIKDLETTMRRVGTSANQLSDNGIRNLVALLDQMKVSGGGGGGGAGGVSNVGTMIKMFQAYGNGKTMTNKAVQEFADAGIINTDGIDMNKSIAAQRSLLKNAGLSNSQQLNQDPVAALTKIAEAAFRSMTSNPKQIKKYFGSEDADTNNPENRRAAMQKWGTSLGMTTTATNTLTTVADPRFQKRAEHQNEMIQGSMNNKELSDVRMKSYQQAVDNFDASLKNLQVTLGTTILPMLTSFFNGINNVVTAMNSFAENNPMAAQLTMIAGAVLSAVLAFKGFTSMLGIVGRAASIFGLFGSSATGAAGAAGAAGRAAGGLLNPFGLLKGSLTGVASAFGGFTSKIGAAGTLLMNSSNKLLPLLGNSFKFLGTLIVQTFGFIGKAFLRAIPFVGWLLLAWDLGGLLMNFQVGGAKIGDWLQFWMDQLLGKASVWWKKFTRLFQSDASAAVTSAAIAEIQKEQEKKAADFEAKRGANEKKSADAKAKSAADNKAAEDKANAGLAEPQIPTDAKEPPGFGTPQDIDWGGDEKKKRGFEDPFISSLAEMRRKTQISSMRVGNSMVGDKDDLVAEGRVAFQEKWLAGDFDEGHDPNKRKFKNADGTLDWNGKSGGSSAEDWVAQYAAMRTAEEQQKALTFARQRGVAAEQDYKAAMERTTGETGKQNRDILALERELARAGERLKNGTADWNAWAAEKNKALEMKSGATLVNFTADFAEDDRKSQADLVTDGYQKQAQALDLAAQKDREQYDSLKESHTKYYNDEMAAFAAQLAAKEISQEQYATVAAAATERYTASATKAETAFTAHVQTQTAVRERAMENSVQKMAREWQNTYAAIESMQSSWANSFIDNMTTIFSGGRVNWREFLSGMVKDMLSAKLKETFASSISTVFGGLGDLLKNTVFANASTAGNGGLGSSLTGFFGSMMGGGASKATTGAGTLAATAANTALTTSTTAATTALTEMKDKGIMSTISSFGSYIMSMFTGTAVKQTETATSVTATTALGTLAGAATAAAASLVTMSATSGGSSGSGWLGSALSLAGTAAATYFGGGGAAAGATAGSTAASTGAMGMSTSYTAYANGGIHSALGSIPLKKYANGGIANSTQLAMFGEGKMNEAYVPLPDGRTIPVTMSGDASTTAGAGVVNNVSIVINADSSGKSTDSSSGTSDAGWADLAKKIKGIVMETIVTEKRPNGILDK